MFRTLKNFVPVIALLAPVAVASAADELRGPHLRAALYELRAARTQLKAAKDAWPEGYKERALGAIDDAIGSIRTILGVRTDDDTTGIGRGEDYYKRYDDHPRLRASLQDLREARAELQTATGDFRGHKGKAIDDIDVAISDILTLIRYKKK